MIRDGFLYIMSNLYRGDFPDQQLSPKMRRWKARRADERGAAFSQDVAAALKAAGWEAATEVALTKLLGQGFGRNGDVDVLAWRSEEHTSELQSLMRISYAVFCLKNKKKTCTAPDTTR